MRVIRRLTINEENACKRASDGLCLGDAELGGWVLSGGKPPGDACPFIGRGRELFISGEFP